MKIVLLESCLAFITHLLGTAGEKQRLHHMLFCYFQRQFQRVLRVSKHM